VFNFGPGPEKRNEQQRREEFFPAIIGWWTKQACLRVELKGHKGRKRPKRIAARLIPLPHRFSIIPNFNFHGWHFRIESPSREAKIARNARISMFGQWL
jgi:hypothetical protein